MCPDRLSVHSGDNRHAKDDFRFGVERKETEVEYRQVHQGQAERQHHDEQKHHAVEPEEGVFPQHQCVWHKKQGKHNGRFQYIGKHGCWCYVVLVVMERN